MMAKLNLVLAVVLVLVLSQLALAAPGPSKYTVVHLTEYCRHGGRTGFSYFPSKDKLSELGYGTLTGNGQRMHYLLGKQIRADYPSIFNDSQPLTNADIEILSSSISRTIQSAWSQLAGLFPQGKGDNITVIPSQISSYLPAYKEPIDVTGLNYEFALENGLRMYPLQVKSAELDFVFTPHEAKPNCPEYSKLDMSLRAKQYEKYAFLIGSLAVDLEAAGFSSKELFGKPKWDIGTLGLLADEIISYKYYYGKIPPELSEAVWKSLQRFQDFKFFLDFSDRRQTLVRGEQAAKAILQGMQDFVKGVPYRRKFRLFSGHDSGLHPHTIMLNLTDLNCNLQKMQFDVPTRPCESSPAFAANYLYELNRDQDTQKHYVRVLYNGKPIKICDQNQDDYYCEFSDFKTKYSQLMFSQDPNEFFALCGNPHIQNAQKTEDAKARMEQDPFIAVYFGVIAIVLMLSLIIWRFLKIKHDLDDEEDHDAIIAKLKESKKAMNDTSQEYLQIDANKSLDRNI